MPAPAMPDASTGGADRGGRGAQGRRPCHARILISTPRNHDAGTSDTNDPTLTGHQTVA